MDETGRRRDSIANEVMTLAYRIPRLVRRIDDVLCVPYVTEARPYK